MTRDFENMLYLFGCSALGKEVNNEYCTNLSKVRELALAQEVWDVVYVGIREKIISGDVKIPPEIFERLEKTFTANIARNMQKVQFNLTALKKIEDAGIKYCVLKGITVAQLYNMPEVRISSDMDILIDEKAEKKVTGILKELGYETKDRAKNDHHMKAYHAVGGLLEVHVALYSIATDKIILDDEISYTEEYVRLENGTYALGINDALIYLTAHLIKHLINDGAGIRQMMDLLLYMKKYEELIDWEKYNALIKKLGYDNFIAVIKGIGVKYWGMDFKDAVTVGNGMEELLEDCEIGGLFSMTEKDRKQFYHIYTQKRAGQNNAQHSMYRLTKSETSPIRMLFPKCSSMKARFSYVDKFPVLLPIGWVHRIIEIVLKQMGIIKEDAENASVHKRRMDMIEKLGMLAERE